MRTTLEREAHSARPSFSPAFHERLMERIAGEAGRSKPLETSSTLTPLRIAVRAPRSLFWFGGHLSGFVAVAAVAAVWMLDRGAIGPDRGDRAAESQPRSVAAVSASNGTPMTGIETLPLYDDLETGFRDGMWTLTASMVELPEWANLADFDAAAIVATDPSP
jgi:hypothetical protein